MPKEKQKARCPICNEQMKLVVKKHVSATFECPKHGKFIVASLEKK